MLDQIRTQLDEYLKAKAERDKFEALGHPPKPTKPSAVDSQEQIDVYLSAMERWEQEDKEWRNKLASLRKTADDIQFKIKQAIPGDLLNVWIIIDDNAFGVWQWGGYTSQRSMVVTKRVDKIANVIPQNFSSS